VIAFVGALVKLFRRRGDEVATSERQGVGGVSAFGGFLSSFEKSPSLATPTERSKTFDQMASNVHIIATAMRYFSAMITGVMWSVVPARIDEVVEGNGNEDDAPKQPPKSKDQKLADEYAKAIDKNLHAMDVPWFRVVRNASQFKWKGFSIQEMIARRMPEIQDGYIGIGTVEFRPQITIERWEIEDRSGIVLGWVQRDPQDGTEWTIDRDKCIYLYDDTISYSPDGVGLLRHVVELAHQLRRLEQLELWAYETDLRGVPVGYAPTAILDEWVRTNKMTRQDADDRIRGLKDFVENHLRNPQLGLLLDSSPYTGQDHVRTPSQVRMWGMELLKGQGVGLGEIHTAIDRKCHEIARTLGVEQFMLGSGGKGSLALSEDKSRNLIELINSVLNEIAWCLRQDYVLKIFELNRWDKKYLPKVVPDAAALRSVSVLVEVLSKIALAGGTLDRNDPVINQIRRMVNLVDQPFVTEKMKGETKPANSGGTPGVKGPGKGPPEKKELPKP
jgi:hypothetical protein